MVDQDYSCSVYYAKYAGSSRVESAGEFLACDTLKGHCHEDLADFWSKLC